MHLVDAAVDHQTVQGTHVASRAEPALAGAVEQDELDVGVVLPPLQGCGQIADHVEPEGVDGPGSIEGQVRDAAKGSRQDGVVVGSLSVHAATLHSRATASPPRRRWVFGPGSGKMG